MLYPLPLVRSPRICESKFRADEHRAGKTEHFGVAKSGGVKAWSGNRLINPVIISYIMVQKRIYQRKSGVWVVDNSPEFIHLFSRDPREYKPRQDGKWVFHNSPGELERITFNLLESHVARGKIEWMKYAPTTSRYAVKRSPLCIYSAEERKGIIHDLLISLSIEPINWYPQMRELATLSLDCI